MHTNYAKEKIQQSIKNMVKKVLFPIIKSWLLYILYFNMCTFFLYTLGSYLHFQWHSCSQKEDSGNDWIRVASLFLIFIFDDLEWDNDEVRSIAIQLVPQFSLPHTILSLWATSLSSFLPAFSNGLFPYDSAFLHCLIPWHVLFMPANHEQCRRVGGTMM